MSSEDKIAVLKLKLKSLYKLKLYKERDVCGLQNVECSMSQELCNTRDEINFLTELLKDINKKISSVRNQISVVEICKISEQAKLETITNRLNIHKKGFQDMFHKEHEIIEIRNRELRDKEEEEQKIKRQKQKEIVQKNEQYARKIEAIDKNCKDIVRECGILKKRNNAIMLKLRRKLVETENARRELMANHGITDTTGDTSM